MRIRLHVVFENLEYSLAVDIAFESALSLRTCDVASRVCELLQGASLQLHGLVLPCIVSVQGNCDDNPAVELILSGPGGVDLWGGRGALEVCQ